MRLLYWITILILGGALYVEKKAGENCWILAEDLSGRLTRWSRAEVALGKPAAPFLDGISDWDSSENPELKSTFHLVWIVNPAECEDCFRFLNPWQALEADTSITRTLIVEGDLDLLNPSALEDFSSRGSLIRTVPLGFLQDRFDREFQSLKLLISPDGEIVLVDARPPNAQCRWSFEAMVSRFVRSPVSIPFAAPREDPPGV